MSNEYMRILNTRKTFLSIATGIKNQHYIFKKQFNYVIKKLKKTKIKQ